MGITFGYQILKIQKMARHFTGSGSAHYDHYMGPMFFEEYAIEIANRIDASTVKFALELGCGTGRVTNHIRRVLPVSARLVASDISADMLAVAKEKLKDSAVEWKSIDFNKIPYGDSSIDLVVCSFGYMFAENKIRAFTEALRVLRPGGTLIITTWDKLEYNEASDVFRKTIEKYFPLPPTFNVPTSMHDPDEIRAQLLEAGFSQIKVDVVEKKCVAESAKIAATGMVHGGSTYDEIIRRNPAWVDEILERVEKELSAKFGVSPMVAKMRALVCEARK